MKKIIRLFFSLHRVIGTIIALFFLMWFLTGLVLIYHPYPRLSNAQKYALQETLPDSLPDIHTYMRSESEGIQNLRIRQFQNQTLLSYTKNKKKHTRCADTLQNVLPITFATAQTAAQRCLNANIRQVDTLHQREQWVLYSKYEQDLPIYRFYFNDPRQHEIFVSSRSGEVLQITNFQSRLWAWLGAIPHKFYLPFIRRDLDIWKVCITIGGILCTLAALTGIIITLHILQKRHKQGNTFRNPYRKPSYRWHYTTGIIFGFFVLAWGISGIFSLQRIPQWLVPMEQEYIFRPSKMWGKKALPLSDYRLDYRTLKNTYPDLKEVTWTHFGNIPAYEIISGEEKKYIDASTSEVKPLNIPQETILAGIQKIHGKDCKFEINILDEYDNYYLSRSLSLPLPVYKIEVDNQEKSLYYVCPTTGYIRYLNTNKKIKKWLFNGIHYLNIQCLTERPILWTVLIWTLCLGGAAVSYTGVWLGYKYISRKIQRQKKTFQP